MRHFSSSQLAGNCNLVVKWMARDAIPESLTVRSSDEDYSRVRIDAWCQNGESSKQSIVAYALAEASWIYNDSIIGPRG